METKRYTINEAIEQSGLSNNYIRKAIAKGDLLTEKELVPGTKNNWRNVILNFDEWRATRTHSTRDDDRNKYVLYMTPEEAEVLRGVMSSMEVPFLDTLTRANLKVVDAK